MDKKFLRCAGIRALKTFCQSALSMITVGAAMTEVDWVTVGSVSLTAAILSLLTSVVTGLPEVKEGE